MLPPREHSPVFYLLSLLEDESDGDRVLLPLFAETWPRQWQWRGPVAGQRKSSESMTLKFELVNSSERYL